MGSFETMIEAYGEPYGDNSALPSLFICGEAHRRVKVALNGDGGDELLAGYGMYNLSPSGAPRRAAREAHLVGTALESAANQAGSALWAHRAAEKIVSALTPCSKIFRLGQFVATGYRGLLFREELLAATEEARRTHERALLDAPGMPRNPVNLMLSADYGHFLAHDLLVKMDIASMHSSLEARSPLLDHELFELCATFPTRLKIRAGEGKFLLKRIAARHVPRRRSTGPRRAFRSLSTAGSPVGSVGGSRACAPIPRIPSGRSPAGTPLR